MVLSLAVGLGLALWQARVAEGEARRADAERAHAERQLARTERVKDFILALFREQDPVARAKAQARTPIDLIRDGLAQIDVTLAAEPDLQAELLRDLGEIQTNLDDRKGGETTLQRAYELQKDASGADSGATAETLATYADMVYASGDTQKAVGMMEQALKNLRATRGADAQKTAYYESRLALIDLVLGRYDDAERLSQHSLSVYRTKFGGEAVEVAPMLATLANIQQETGRLDEALANYNDALAIISRQDGGEHVRTVTLRSKIGDVLRVQRRYDDALATYETALRIERAQLTPGHFIVGGTLLRLGDLQRRMQRFDDADRSLTESIAILSKTKSGQYAQALQFHGDLARAQGQIQIAIERWRASRDMFRESTGDGIYTWLTTLKVVEGLTEAGRLDEAETLGNEAVTAIAKLGDNPYDVAYSSSVMGALRHAQGREVESVALFRRSVGLLTKIYGEQHGEVAQERVALAGSLVALHEADARSEAATLLESAKGTLEGAEHAGDHDSTSKLGVLYLERAVLRMDAGDTTGARADVVEAMHRLQAPGSARSLRRAIVIGRKLNIRT
jgi:tetratricopeptide (TPR) repeat protein